MAITFIHGPPGGGKTYYAVNHLLQNFFEYDKELDDYFIKDENIKIVTNIDEFKPKHYSLDDWIMHAGSVKEFFSYSTQEKIHEKHSSLIYMIDEAHQFFPSTMRDNEILNWFSYHRHWGQTIYLMSQSYSRLPRQITDMIELNIKALPASTSLFGGKDLKYNILSGREIVDRKALIKNKRIFEQYKSQSSDSKEKTKNPLLKYIVGCLIISVLLIGNALRWASNFGKHDNSAQASESSINVNPLEIRDAQQQVPQVKKIYDPVPVSWAKFKRKTFVVYLDKFYSLESFPYKVTMNSLGEMIAMIPRPLQDPPTPNNPLPPTRIRNSSL